MGQLDNSIVVFIIDNGAETISFPDGGTTPFEGDKLSPGEGGLRVPAVVRWPGHINPARSRTTSSRCSIGCPRLSTSLAAQRRRAEEADRGRPVSGHRQDHARWRRSDRVPFRTFGKVGARYLLLLSNKHPSAVRYKNWKIYFTIGPKPRRAFSPRARPFTAPRWSISSAIHSRPPLVRE